MRLLRVYHAGRNTEHRKRDLALASLGAHVTLVVPTFWEQRDAADLDRDSRIEIIELPVTRPSNVNFHRHVSSMAVRHVVADLRPDILDLHEEPFSLVTRQWLRAAPRALPVVVYSAQNVDKRFPPPFAQYERAALRRINGMYPCSRQAASVARGKGFAGPISVLPLGSDPTVIFPGDQGAYDPVVTLGLVGRMVPEKGVLDAVRVLAAVQQIRPARLLLIGDGPELPKALELATQLGVAASLEVHPWTSTENLSNWYRQMHVILAPSSSTSTWTEQFGRMITEGQRCGAVPVGYASGAIPEVIGDAGLVVDAGDVLALQSAVVALVNLPGNLEQMRERGLATSSRCDWTTIASAQMRLYDAVLSPGAAAAPTGREVARLEFGAPASLGGVDRPFALPLLRDVQRRWHRHEHRDRPDGPTGEQ